jgi:hypothetical protein
MNPELDHIFIMCEVDAVVSQASASLVGHATKSGVM